MKRTANRRRNRGGFTLVELLIVLGILVLLVALVTPKILGTQKKADINMAKTQIGSFKGSLEQYAVDMKDFPTTEQGLQALAAAPAGTDGISSSRWDGSYINSDVIPKDPWGNNYQYAYPPVNGTGEYPDIWSFGPDGQDATGDEIVSWHTSAVEGEGEVDDLLGDDLGSEDLGSPDLGSPDLGSPDLGSPDLGSPDLGGGVEAEF